MTESPFYRIGNNPPLSNRWFLQAPVASDGAEVDPRIFTQGIPVDLTGRLSVALRRPGWPLDFTLADFDMPIVTERLGQAVKEVCSDSVQLVEASVEGQAGRYFVLNVTSLVPCLDEKASAIQWWLPSDGRPDKVGTYRMVLSPVLTVHSRESAGIFRVQGWPALLVCTLAVRRRLEAAGFSGFEFQPIESSAAN